MNRRGPDFVLEITSRRTYREDRGPKRELYRSLRVQEYWQYDPTQDYLRPPLQGLELIGEDYQRLPGRELRDGTLALASRVLGLELRLMERGLRFHDPETGQDLQDLAETDAARQRAEQERAAAETRLAQEAAAREAAEARVAQLEALLRQEPGSDSGGSR